jgi:hypothetical protein
MIFGSKKAALDAKLPDGNLQDLEVRNFLHRGRRFVNVVGAARIVSMCVAHSLFSFLV